MKLTISILVLFLFISPNWLHGVSTGHNIAIAPFRETHGVDIHDSEELFDSCPGYLLDNPRQFLLHNGWKGDDDFSAKVRLFWSANSIFFRFDVVDDKYVSSSTNEDGKIDGDFIQINLAHLTCGPDRSSVAPWSVLMLPDLEQESCNFVLKADSDIKRSKIGKIEGAISRTMEGYSMIVKLPYEKWDDLPRRAGMTRLQILFGDSDASGHIDHQFVLFPADRGRKNLLTKASEYGHIRYAKSSWVTVFPRETVYSDHKATLLADFGNLADRPIDVIIYPEEGKRRQTFESLDGAHQVTHKLDGGTSKQNVPIELNFKGLPTGTYRINGKAGVFYDSGAFLVKYSSKSGLIYCPNLIERRKKVIPRNLSVLNHPESVEATFHNLAGGGDVLWSVGRYDASSNDFPQYIRKIDEHVIKIPKTGEKGIPWALFGGLNALDGMNEPLILNLSSELGNPNTKLSPDAPLIKSRKNPSRSIRETYKYLLLVGIIVKEIDKDSLPTLHISRGSKTLLNQTVRPTRNGKGGTRHSYVFRVWLSTLDKDIKIENTAKYGSKFELDFIALLGGSKDHTKSLFNDGPSISFAGNSFADIFSKQVQVSQFLLKHYFVSDDGKAYSSLPGGRSKSVDLRDWGMLTSELSAWGVLDQASVLAQKTPLIQGISDNSKSSNDFTIGDAVAVTGIYNTWKKLGKNKSFLDPIWLPSVHQPLTDLSKEIGTNPLRLVNCRGEFGVNDSENPGATLPMYFAAQAALNSGASMAKESGYAENAGSWKLASDRLSTGFKRHLVSSETRVKLVSQEVFPESWGISEQQGIASLLPNNAWVYGRYFDERPVLYNEKIRVFDTPYLLSGVSFWCDYSGFILSQEMDKQLKASFDYLLSSSPVFKKPSWSKFYMVDYNKSVLQLWTAMAGFLLDSIPIATNTLTSYIKFSFDEFIPVPEFSDNEVSPYTFEEKLNTSANGKNKGATFDDLNVLNGTTALKAARIIAGIDDYNSAVLNLVPRLPDGWKRVEAKDWVINHDSAASGATRIQYSYERVAEGRFAMVLESIEKLDTITIRMGPFSSKTRKVRVSGGGVRTDVSTFHHGFYSWATQTFKKAKSLDLVVQEIIY